MASSSDTDNVIAALGQSNIVYQVNLTLAGRQLENVLAAMQVPFPELTNLALFSDSETPPVIPDSFLGGSAPRLRILSFSGIQFPGLPNLFLTATHLVNLWLSRIPHSGYISPASMVALLSALSSLESLHLRFESPQSRPDSQIPSLPPLKRSVLPALKEVNFICVTEYLEDLVTRIDTPQLNALYIIFFNQIDFDCPRLAQFINRTPTPRAPYEAHVQFNDRTGGVNLRPRRSQSGLRNLEIAISCREPDWQLSSMEQVCNFSLHPLCTVEYLYIEDDHLELVWKDDAIENTLWLELLLPFTTVKDLYISKKFAPGIAAALQELVGGMTEVLPSLQNIFVEELEESGPVSENIGQFVVARRLSGHPIAISNWDRVSLRAYIDGERHIYNQRSENCLADGRPGWNRGQCVGGGMWTKTFRALQPLLERVFNEGI
jgi:hypothetical protein